MRRHGNEAEPGDESLQRVGSERRVVVALGDTGLVDVGGGAEPPRLQFAADTFACLVDRDARVRDLLLEEMGRHQP
ncbi:hypothetical protein D3C83_122030 [compost metagenome]